MDRSKTIASQLRQLQSEIDAQRTWFINASSQREEQLEKDVQRAALLIKKDHDVSLLTKRNDGLVTDLECLFALHEERLTWRLEQEKAEMQEDLRTMRETLLCLEAGGARGQDSRPIEEQHFETPKPRLEESNQARRLDEELFEVDSEDESYGDLSETFQGLEERFGGEALHDDGYAPINPPTSPTDQ
ncbi:hypothetical protein E8E12_000666 [Didymella heteroderae]|uniref:Uncharacterized protein n=1 Tax=Didymella heteroderae TaxID=1769908 RepID=A0A9P5BUG8_9PLEO|nr:hypothetical protein E8E12_000666 [Didymella heteroderae]